MATPPTNNFPNGHDLDELAVEMNRVVPPPREAPTNTPGVIAGTGRWIVVRTGGGQYAVRLEYSTVSGDAVQLAPTTEIRGYPSTVASAMRFAMTYSDPGRYNWVAV